MIFVIEINLFFVRWKLKGKVVPDHAIKAYGSGGIAPLILNLSIRRRSPGTHWMGGWLGSRAGLDALYLDE